MSVKRLFPTLFLLVLLVVLGQPVQACMEPICPIGLDCPILPGTTTAGTSGLAPADETRVTLLGGRRALIEIPHYVTPAMTSTYACSVAFSPVDGIERVNGIRLVNVDTREILPNYFWEANDEANRDYTDLASAESIMDIPAAGWKGFFTEVQGGSQGGIIHSFVVEVTLKKGVSPQQLLFNLKKQGVLANGSAQFNGALDFGHYHFRRLGDGDINFVLPGRLRGGVNPSEVR